MKIKTRKLTLEIRKRGKDVVYERNGETFEDNDNDHQHLRHSTFSKLPTLLGLVYT